MDIRIKLNKDFEKNLNVIDERYGEDFELLNGFHESQLNFSDFVDSFVDKNVADVTIDANANAHHKDVCSLVGERGKSEDKLFAFNKIFYVHDCTEAHDLCLCQTNLLTESGHTGSKVNQVVSCSRRVL